MQLGPGSYNINDKLVHRRVTGGKFSESRRPEYVGDVPPESRLGPGNYETEHKVIRDSDKLKLMRQVYSDIGHMRQDHCKGRRRNDFRGEGEERSHAAGEGG